MNRESIKIPPYHHSEIPQLKPYQVRNHLMRIKTNKSTAPGDIPAKIIKEFALFLCVPVTDIINCGLIAGHWPTTYKRETITPTPKQFPPETTEVDKKLHLMFSR